MKKEKRYWYSKAGGHFHAVYPPVKGHRLTTLCEIKLSAPFRNVIGAMDGTWKQNAPRCKNCRRFLKI